MSVTKVNHRKAYLARWRASHPGYWTGYNHRRAMAKVPRRAYYVEILGVRVRVNLLVLAVPVGQQFGLPITSC